MLASNETMIQKRELDSQRKRTLIMKQKVLQQERRLRAKETEFEQIRNAQENARRLRRDREEFANLIQQQREAKLEECKRVKRAQQQKHYSNLDTPQRPDHAREHAQEEYYKQMVQYNKKVQEINQINQKRENERKRLLQLKSVLEQQDRQLHKLTDAKNKMIQSERNAKSSYSNQLAKIQTEQSHLASSIRKMQYANTLQMIKNKQQLGYYK